VHITGDTGDLLILRRKSASAAQTSLLVASFSLIYVWLARHDDSDADG
jgi:hypothetical protein